MRIVFRGGEELIICLVCEDGIISENYFVGVEFHILYLNVVAILLTVAIDILTSIGQTLRLSHLTIVFSASPALLYLTFLLILLPPFPQFPNTGIVKTNRHISFDILHGL